MKKITFETKIIFLVVIGILSLSVGYAASVIVLDLGGNVVVMGDKAVVIEQISSPIIENEAFENYDTEYNRNILTVNGNLPTLDSTIAYFITLRNITSYPYEFSGITIDSNSNENVVYEIEGLNEGYTISAGQTATIYIKFLYDPTIDTISENKDYGFVLDLNFIPYDGQVGTEMMFYTDHDLSLNLKGYNISNDGT